MTTIVSACGLECNTCPFFQKSCQGCEEVQGRPFWTHEHLAGKPCPIYDCCRNLKSLPNCAPCSDLPCRIFMDLRDPSASEEEHLKGIERRVSVLKG